MAAWFDGCIGAVYWTISDGVAEPSVINAPNSCAIPRPRPRCSASPNETAKIGRLRGARTEARRYNMRRRRSERDTANGNARGGALPLSARRTDFIPKLWISTAASRARAPGSMRRFTCRHFRRGLRPRRCVRVSTLPNIWLRSRSGVASFTAELPKRGVEVRPLPDWAFWI